jgi:membrane peptidoglycan carboxypeptidase
MKFLDPVISRSRSMLSGRPRLLAGLVSSIAIALFLSAGYVAWFSYDVAAGLPGTTAVRGIGDMAQSTTIYDAKDQPVFTIFKEQRIEVPLDRISPHFLKAVISVEDQRFYEHSGVDAIRVAAAALRGGAPLPSSSPARASSAATRRIAANSRKSSSRPGSRASTAKRRSSRST